jgi:beta-glucosidase
VGRAPEGGRNWEGFSPDPVLSGVCVAQTVKGESETHHQRYTEADKHYSLGIQDSGVIATTKHYILNEQEHFRSNGDYNGTYYEGSSSNIDDVTMHELYMWPFGRFLAHRRCHHPG